MRLSLLLSFLALSAVSLASAKDPSVVVLWPNGAPGADANGGKESVRVSETGDHIITNVHQPSLLVYLPHGAKAPTRGVVVIPGGGHREIWIDHEGHNVARWLNAHGIAAFVVKYRLAKQEGSHYRVEVESLHDVQRAIRTVRAHSAEWHVDPRRVGVIGFSAGGELAALAGAHFDDGDKMAADPIDQQSCRPSFQALMYAAGLAQIQPDATMPPAFIVCGEQDWPMISEGSAEAYLRFKRANVPVELHIYSGTGHGFGIRATNHTPSATWPDRFYDWLNALENDKRVVFR